MDATAEENTGFDESGIETVTKPIHEISMGMMTPVTLGGLATPGGITSSNGMNTPSAIELRKEESTSNKIDFGQPLGEDELASDKPLYTVLSTKENRVSGSTLMGSDYVYNIPGEGTMFFFYYQPIIMLICFIVSFCYYCSSQTSKKIW